MEMDVEQTVQRHRDALRILDRSARAEGFAQIFADTSALAKDRDTSFEDHLQVFYGLLGDLLELTSGAKQPVLRNAHLSRELEALSKVVDSSWVMRAIAGFDDLHSGLRRNLNRQLGLDALVASLAPNPPRANPSRAMTPAYRATSGDISEFNCNPAAFCMHHTRDPPYRKEQSW